MVAAVLCEVACAAGLQQLAAAVSGGDCAHGGLLSKPTRRNAAPCAAHHCLGGCGTVVGWVKKPA